MEVRYYPPETGKYCTEGGGCSRNFGHLYFDSSKQRFQWDTKGFTPDFIEHHNYYEPIVYGYVQQNYFEEACFSELSKGQGPKYETAATWPSGYQCTETAIENQCYQFRSEYSSPLNLGKVDPPYGSPDNWVEFKPVTFNADKSLACFDNNCALTHPLAVSETQFDFDAVLRRTTMHEMGHALLTAKPADHCSNDGCILQGGVKDWTLHPFGTTCGHKDLIKGGVHNSRD
jgi:hypothetical protein